MKILKKSTAQLLELFKKSNNIKDCINSNSDELICDNPCKHLEETIEQKGLKKSDVIRKSEIERHYAYQILSGVRKASRDKIIMLCFGMELNEEETQRMLKTFSMPTLYARNRRDSVVLFAIEKHLSVIEMNELLFELNLNLFS